MDAHPCINPYFTQLHIVGANLATMYWDMLEWLDQLCLSSAAQTIATFSNQCEYHDMGMRQFTPHSTLAVIFSHSLSLHSISIYILSITMHLIAAIEQPMAHYNLLKSTKILMPQEQENLKWGDIIRIHGVSVISEEKGLIISKGFTDPNIYYQKYVDFAQVNFYRESLFQIIPKCNFDLHDQLHDEKLTIKEREQLRERAKEEVGLLKRELQQKAGKQVTYGDQAIFKHVESGEYLSGVLKAADIGEGAFKLQLAQDLSSFLIFRIGSHRSYQHDGNTIYFDDCLRIYHVKSDCYMNFPNTQIPIIFDREYQSASFGVGQNSFQHYQNRPNIKKPVGKRINVINQNKSKCLWKFIQHCTYEVSLQKDKIKSHDIVYFQHTKDKGLIASALAKQKYYLKELKNSQGSSPSYQCFWQLIPMEVNEFGPEKGNSFWARNIVTGQILKYEDYKVQVVSKEKVENGGFNSEGLVNLVCSENKELLERGQPIPPDHSLSKIIQYFEQKIKKVDFKAVQQLSEDSFIIVRVSDQTILDVSYVLSSQQAFIKVVEIFSTEMKKKRQDPNLQYKDLFLVLNEDLLASFICILKMLSGKIFGCAYEEIQTSGNNPIKQIQKILVQTGIAQLLIQLVFTLYQPFKFIQRDREIGSDRAIRFKIVQIFQLSYRLIERIVKDFEENKIYFSRWVDLFLLHSNNINKSYIQECLVGILQNNYKSIQTTIDREKINALIQCFFKEVKDADQGQPLTTKYLRLFSTFIRCQTKVIKENQHIILNDFFNNPQNQHIFKFKTQFPSTQGQQIGEQTRDRQKTKIVKIIYGSGRGMHQSLTIPQFFQKYSSKFNYMLDYVNLLADICMQKNNQAIQYIQSVLPLAVVSSLLFDPEITQLNEQLKAINQICLKNDQLPMYPNAHVHQPFIRIGHHAYVHNLKFSPIRNVRKIVNWYKEEEEELHGIEDITKTKRVYEGQKEEEEKNHLNNLLRYIRSFLESCDKQPCNLNILYTVLSFLKTTIVLGLWQTIEEFRQIIPLLVKNIIKIQSSLFFSGDQDEKKNFPIIADYINANKEKLTMNRPQVAEVIKCKTKATQIFKYMNQMQIDIRLRYMHNFFQGLYQAYQNFQVYNEQIQDNCEVEGEGEEVTKITDRNDAAKKQFYKMANGTILGGDVKKVSQDQDIMLKENIWYNKIRKMIPLKAEQSTEQPDKDRDLFKNARDNYPLSNIVLSLFQLSGYMNKELLNYSLNMMRSMFQQRNDLIENYKSLLICGKGNLNEVYHTLKFMRNKFAMLENDAIWKFDGVANKSFPYAIFKPYDHLGREQTKRSGIVQDLFFLARTLKDNVSLKNIQSLMHVDPQIFNKNNAVRFYTQREKNNSLFQQLNMAEGIYFPLLSYIKIMATQQISQIHRCLLFSIFQYLTLLCFNNMKAKHIFMKYIDDILPHLTKRVGAASFLYQVCINNKILVNNQNIIKKIIQGCLEACAQLQQQEMISGVMSLALAQDLKKNNDYQKSRILSSLRGIIIFNDEGHKGNQQMLMNKLQDNKYRKLIINQFQEEQEHKNFRYNSKKQDFVLNPAQTYATTHFQLLSSLVESQNRINIGKLQNLHRHSYLLNCLANNNRWQLRRALRSYVNRLYYVPNNEIHMCQSFIRREFQIINDQLKDLIDLHKSKMLADDLKVKNSIRFVYAQSQITLFIIEILISLHQMFLKQIFLVCLRRELQKQKKEEEHKKKLTPHLFKLLKNLGSINLLYPHTKIIKSFINEIKKAMTQILLTFHVRQLERKSQPDNKESKQPQTNEQQVEIKSKGYVYDHSRPFFRNLVQMIRDVKHRELQQKFKKQQNSRKNEIAVSDTALKLKYTEVIFNVPGQVIKPISSGRPKPVQEHHYKPHLGTANSNIFKVLAKPDLQQNEENNVLNQRLSRVKDLLTDSPVFKKLKQDQFYKLVRIFTQIDQTSKQYYSEDWRALNQEIKPVFSRRELIRNCFTLIINNPNLILDAQKIFIIKLVRCYISQAVQDKQNHKLSVDLWSADYYSDQTAGYLNQDLPGKERSQLVKRQHQIQECGGSQFLVSIFKQNLYSRPQLLNEALLLGIIYLFNGNTYCQNSLLKQLKADTFNEMPAMISQLVKQIGNFLIQVRSLKQIENKRAFSYKIVDAYDYFDMKENMLIKLFGHKSDKFQVQTENDYEMALCRIFRFMQLVCQNNNIQTKKFILAQTDLDGSIKPNTKNFIKQACQLLRKFFKIMSVRVVSIPSSLLNFLNQVTQIPCLDNQIALLKQTFFEDISYLAGFFENKQNIQQRKFNFVAQGQQDPLHQLTQIYTKGIQLSLSNFQGNNTQIYWQYLNKCQPKYLWIVMKQNLIKILKQDNQMKKLIDKDQIRREYEVGENDQSLPKQVRDDRSLYKQYYIEQQYITAMFAAFTKDKIKECIKRHKQVKKTFCGQICNILNVIAILKKVEDYAAGREKEIKNEQNPNVQENLKAYKAKQLRIQLKAYAKNQYPHIQQFIQIFQQLILQIEVSSFNGMQVNLQNVYFPLHPVFQSLPDDTRDNIMMAVERNSRRDKLTTLFQFRQQLQWQIQSNYNLYYNFCSYFKLQSNLINTIRLIARLVSTVIVLLMMYFIIMEHDLTEQASYFTFYNSRDKIIMRVISLLQLILTLTFSGLWIKMRLGLCLSKYDKQQSQQQEEEEGGEQIQQQIQQITPHTLIQKVMHYTDLIGSHAQTAVNLPFHFYSRFTQFLAKYSEYPVIRHCIWMYSYVTTPILLWVSYLKKVIIAFNRYQSGFLSIVFFVFVALYANLTGVQWYILHMFDYFAGIGMLSNVFKAILKNLSQLTILSLFAGCFILVFNILSLNTYTPVIYQDDIPKQSCQDIIKCVLQVYTSGAIGQTMDNLYIGRLLFDTVYVVFMEMLFGNLVSGMMIDTFQQLGEADTERKQDKEGICYICGMQKADMEKEGIVLNKHIKNHFLWNYVFYAYCLQIKDPSDYTGLEYQISNQLGEDKVEWFPDREEKDKDAQAEGILQRLKDTVKEFSSRGIQLISKTNEQHKNACKALLNAKNIKTTTLQDIVEEVVNIQL